MNLNDFIKMTLKYTKFKYNVVQHRLCIAFSKIKYIAVFLTSLACLQAFDHFRLLQLLSLLWTSMLRSNLYIRGFKHYTTHLHSFPIAYQCKAIG